MVLDLRACSFLPQNAIIFHLFSLFCFAVVMDRAVVSGSHLGILLWINWRRNHLQKRKSKGHLVPAPHTGGDAALSAQHPVASEIFWQRVFQILPCICHYISWELTFFPPNQTYIFFSAIKLIASCQLWKTTGHGKQLIVMFFTVIFYILEMLHYIMFTYICITYVVMFPTSILSS